LADDVAALVDALHLDRPLVCGFSDGGEVATIVAIRHPGSVRAVVNHAGYDCFNPDPDAPSYAITRQMLGGTIDAGHADPDTVGSSGELRGMFDLMRADHDNAQGSGHWKTVVSTTFERISRPHGYRIEDLGDVAVPVLLLVGDRDPFCTVEEGAGAYHAIPDGEFGVLSNTGHLITAAAIEMTVDFLRRHQSLENGSPEVGPD
jgi:pimeloyl-ACP methyl ester carboxylesterase